MPARSLPLTTGGFYHVLNRGFGAIPIFRRKSDYCHFLTAVKFYRYASPPLRLSFFKRLSIKERERLRKRVEKENSFLVELVAYCLLPNHFHLLLKQTQDKGIIQFMQRVQNSYSHYFNQKYQRKGSLFESRFTAVRVETEEQLLHLSRYIHLNPLTAGVIKNTTSLLNFPHSSLPEYSGRENSPICQTETILHYFPSVESYLEFVLDRASYQKTLHLIQHQTLEEKEKNNKIYWKLIGT